MAVCQIAVGVPTAGTERVVYQWKYSQSTACTTSFVVMRY